MSNVNLNKAQQTKNDEFYTLYEDIEEELQHYIPLFRNKIVYCNCDKPSESKFYKFFKDNFKTLKLKKLISTYYSKTTHPFLTSYNGRIITRKQLKGNGSFDSPECVRLLKQSDIIVTNPPFSLFTTYMPLLVNSGKKFLIIGNFNALTNKELFPLIRNGKIKLGFDNGPHTFKTPKGQAQVLTAWYTNLPIVKRMPKLELEEVYRKKNYPKFDYYNAIECGTVKNIPKNYKGEMGVPITYMMKHAPSQFKITGELRDGSDSKWDKAKPYVNGVKKYARLLIQKK